MISLSQLPVRFCPSKETLSVLNSRTWICSYSGGKDSTAVVTWIEWLRRIGMVKVETPRLVMSDTEVEYPFLSLIASDLMSELKKTGWKCEIVRPKINEKLYNRIFGIGNTPVHPGGRKRMRWCTRATKIDPMRRFSKTVGDNVVMLSGVRWGESETRDGKLKTSGCSAGGECGLPDPGEGVYGPIITWRTCKVIEWLSGDSDGAADSILDLLPIMRKLIDVYEVVIDDSPTIEPAPPRVVSAMRFGCVGCPAISNERVTKSKQAQKHPQWSHLRRIYGIWDRLYANANRCFRIRAEVSKVGDKGSKWSNAIGYGPLKMAARQQYFVELLDIQRDSGVTLVTAEDEAFIRDCWRRGVYPRGWSEKDELVEPPYEPTLWDAVNTTTGECKVC